jgi:hypothetical protein
MTIRMRREPPQAGDCIGVTCGSTTGLWRAYKVDVNADDEFMEIKFVPIDP